MLKKFLSVFYYDKIKYENFLDDPNSNVWRLLDLSILVLTLLFPILLIFENILDNSSKYMIELLYFDAFVSSAFMLEYIYRFICSKNKLSFIFSFSKIIDLLSFLPFFLWIFAWDFIKLLRAVRLLRILRFVKRIPITNWFLKSLNNYSDEYRAIFTLYWLILFFGSFIVYYIEKDLPWSDFTSIWLSFWWWLVTMATVWYWDIVPISDFWKFIWSFLVFLWPIIWALIWAVTIMVFKETTDNEESLTYKKTRVKECYRCKSLNPKFANYCMKCWETFFKNK